MFKDAEDGFEDQPDIVEKAALFYVVAVEFGFDGDLEFVAPADLGKPGQPDLDVVGVILVALGDQVVLIPQGGAGSDKTHLSGEDIEKLRQFVDRGLTNKTTHLSDMRLGIS